MTKLINKQRLNIKEDKELYYILQIITAVVFRNFVEKFSKELTDDEAIHNFTMEMNLLKRRSLQTRMILNVNLLVISDKNI